MFIVNACLLCLAAEETVDHLLVSDGLLDLVLSPSLVPLQLGFALFNLFSLRGVECGDRF